MEKLYFILGGVFSWVLISVIRFIKQNLKHNFEKQSIQKRINEDNSLAERYGDIESFLNDSFEYRKSNFINELSLNGLRPLIVLGFAFLFNGSNPITTILLFIILIFFCIHEFLYAEKLKSNNCYRAAIVAIWIIFSCNILFNNSSEPLSDSEKTENTNNKDNLDSDLKEKSNEIKDTIE